MNGISIERVSEYKYLGVWLSATLEWMGHVNRVVRRASQQVGMIYRTFYQFSNSETLLWLYVTHDRPLLEYASKVWDPHQRTLIDSLERVQKFGLRMSQKSWDCDYDDLMAWANLPSLKTRRTIDKLCYIAKILHGAVHLPTPLPSLGRWIPDCAVSIQTKSNCHMQDQTL